MVGDGLALSTLITLVLTALVFSYVIELVLKLRHALGLAEVVVTGVPKISKNPKLILLDICPIKSIRGRSNFLFDTICCFNYFSKAH